MRNRPASTNWLGPGVVIALLAIGGIPSAYAVRHRIVDCANLLLAQRADHFVPSISEKYTRTALDELRVFRARHLGTLSFTPGNRAGEVDSTSSVARRTGLSRRLSALLAEGAEADSPTESANGEGAEPRRQITRASSIEGVEDVAAFLDRLGAVPPADGPVADALTQDDVFFAFKLPLAAAPVGFMVYTAVMLPLNSTDLIALGLFAMARHVPEATARGLGIYAWRTSLADRMRQRLAETNGPEWFAISQDFVVPSDILHRTWMTDELSPADASLYGDWLAYPKLSTRLTGRKIAAYPLSPVTERLRPAHLRVDAVITKSGAGGGPSLVFATRVSEALPPYPRRAPVRTEARTPMAQHAGGYGQ